VRPLLKWAGGKRSILDEIFSLFPMDFREKRYHEPFFGGGAVFFKAEPTSGTISDINPRLMNFYKVVRDEPEGLIEHASEYMYDRDEFYARRSEFNQRPEDRVLDAGLLLYLNKTCYNGLYRVNSKGEFNVPFGRYKDPVIVNEERIREGSKLLAKVDIRCQDFSYILDEACEGELCYLDPPYYPSSKTANFTDYSENGFIVSDQVRLRDVCLKLNERGVFFILSNSDMDIIRELYDNEEFDIIPLRTNRNISRKVSSRTSGYELLITNRPH